MPASLLAVFPQPPIPGTGSVSSGRGVFPLAGTNEASIIIEVTIMDKQTEYVEQLSAQIVEWDAQIDLLKDKAESAAPGEKSEYSREIAALQLKRDQAAQELQGIAPTSDDQWGDVQEGSENVMDEVRTIVSDAITKIN